MSGKVPQKGGPAKPGAAIWGGHTNFEAGQILRKNSKSGGADCVKGNRRHGGYAIWFSHQNFRLHMKQLYSLLFMLALTLGCKHESLVHEFAVVCDFSIFNPHILLITNEVGDVVHEIPIQPGTSAIYERFLMPTDDPDATFGLHLLQRYSVDWTQYFNVYSHCGVKNGMHIVLGAAESLTNTLKRASRPTRPISTSHAFALTPIFLNYPT